MPTVLRGPGFRTGIRLPELVSHVDLPPTLVDSAGLPVPDAMQGRSLLPLLHGEDPEWPRDVLIQISESEMGRALRTDRWKYGVTAHDMRAETYQDAYLYDLETDPDELTNLVDDPSHAGVLRELRERLTQRVIASGEPRPAITSR